MSDADKPKDERPRSLPGVSQRITTGWGKVYVNITVDEDGHPFEVFVTVGRSGGLFNAQAEAIGKTISTGLRMADDREAAARELAANLVGIRSDRIGDDNGDEIYSIPDAIGIAMIRFLDGRLGRSVRDNENGEILP